MDSFDRTFRSVRAVRVQLNVFLFLLLSTLGSFPLYKWTYLFKFDCVKVCVSLVLLFSSLITHKLITLFFDLFVRFSFDNFALLLLILSVNEMGVYEIFQLRLKITHGFLLFFILLGIY